MDNLNISRELFLDLINSNTTVVAKHGIWIWQA